MTDNAAPSAAEIAAIREMLQTWKPIPGYEGLYEISSDGLIRIGKSKPARGQILKQRIGNRGYKRICLCKKRVKKTYHVHALMMLAFVGPRPINETINHINGIRTDNHIGNLEYCTASANQKHRYDVLHQTAPTGENNGKAKLTSAGVREILRLYASEQYSYESLAKKYSVSSSTIGRIIRRENWTSIND